MKPLWIYTLTAILATLCLSVTQAFANVSASDFKPRQQGEGPYSKLIIKNANLIDGVGGPMTGPVNIVVEGNRITNIQHAAGMYHSGDVDSDASTRVIDATGKYVLPGFINGHAHIHSLKAGEFGFGGKVPSEYITKLWMAHGITTVKEVGNISMDWITDVSERSARNEILSPRVYPYIAFGARSSGTEINDADASREFMRSVKNAGAHGVKFFGARKPILQAAFDEADKLGLKTTMHHEQVTVVEADVMRTSEWGLDGMEHWYGLPESLFYDRIVQNYSRDYNYLNEQDRFGQAGQLWKQAAPPGHPRYEEVMDTLLERDFHITPTFTIYIANRDWSKARTAEWHNEYVLPGLWEFFRPNYKAHGSYWFDWTQEMELDWQENFRIWMRFINDYKNRGGLVGVGEDAGYIYTPYGFGYIRELELLREAGFHPLEVIRAATLINARILGVDDEIGSVEVGKKADLVIVPENPLQNLKTLYATGHIRVDLETGDVNRVGGVDYTIKDGIIYDARQLMEEIKDEVRQAKEKQGIPPGPMPIAKKKPR